MKINILIPILLNNISKYAQLNDFLLLINRYSIT